MIRASALLLLLAPSSRAADFRPPAPAPAAAYRAMSAEDSAAGGGEDEACGSPRDALKIGVVLPLSGEGAIYGIPNWYGILTGLMSSRQLKGRSLSLELLVYDDEGRPELAARAARELEREGAIVALGSAGSAATRGLLKGADGKFPVISAQASADDLKNDWFFRTTIPNERLAKLAVQDLRGRKALDGLGDAGAHVLYDARDEYSRDLFENIAEQLGEQAPVHAMQYESTGAAAAQIGELKEDARLLFLVTGSERDAAQIMGALDEARKSRLKSLKIAVFELHPAVADTDAFEGVLHYTSFNAAGDERLGVNRLKKDYRSAQGLIKSCHAKGFKCRGDGFPANVCLRARPLDRKWAFQDLGAGFREQLAGVPGVNKALLDNGSPSYAVALGYDQAGILAEALSSGPADGARLRARLEETVHDGALGLYVFSPRNHDGTGLPVLRVRPPAKKPDPVFDAWLVKRVAALELGLERVSASIGFNYSRVVGDADSTQLGFKPKLSYTIAETRAWRHSFSAYYSQDRIRQLTKTAGFQSLQKRTAGIDVWEARYVKHADLAEPYLAGGLGFTKIEPASTTFNLIWRVGAKVPLTRYTKALKLDLSYEDQRKASGLTGRYLKTFQAALELGWSAAR